MSNRFNPLVSKLHYAVLTKYNIGQLQFPTNDLTSTDLLFTDKMNSSLIDHIIHSPIKSVILIN